MNLYPLPVEGEQDGVLAGGKKMKQKIGYRGEFRRVSREFMEFGYVEFV